MFVVASLFDAFAPLASERATPATPNAGKVLLRRLLFEARVDMAQFSHPFGHIELINILRPALMPGQVSKFKFWLSISELAARHQ